MCGIAGEFAYIDSAPRADLEALARVQDSMRRRGPDAEGRWASADGRVALAHRRLSIIDLSDAGLQPMASNNGSLRIVFNGEIYNHRELRSELEARGSRFNSRSDTEVILQLYHAHGRDMLARLRGMFAFALWDERRQGLLLARDMFGIKPLYVADDGKSLRFASQVKALRRDARIDSSPEPAGHAGFQLWGHIPEPYTLFKGIRAFAPGQSLWVERGGKKSVDIFLSVTQELASAQQRAANLKPSDKSESLRAALRDAVRAHMISDVPVGIFLSAGVDSSALVALARQAGAQNLHTLTLGFKEYAGLAQDETPLAQATAKRYETIHQTCWATRRDFEDELDRLLEAMDQPSIDGVNTYFVCRAARQAGLNVVLSGLGADELFGGYPSFRQIPRMVRAFSPFLHAPGMGRALRRASEPLVSRVLSHKFAGLAEYGGDYSGAYLLRRALRMPWSLGAQSEMLAQGLKELDTRARLEQSLQGLHAPHLRVSALEMQWYMRNQLLRDSDWASMAHSIELRVPFVDIELLRAAAPFAAGPGLNKRDLALTPEPPLPEGIITRPKTGFSIPVAEWAMAKGGARIRQGKIQEWGDFIYRNF